MTSKDGRFNKKMKNNKYFEEKIKWEKTDDAEYPYETEHKGELLKLRINDFPEEPLYTLFVNGEEVCDFDDWSENWTKNLNRPSGSLIAEAHQ